MFYPYNENLIKSSRNRPPHLISHILSIICIGISIIGIVNKNKDLIIMGLLFVILNYSLVYLDIYKSTIHPRFYARKYADKLDLFINQGISLGAELKEDYMIVRGLLFTEVSHNDTYSRNYFVEKKIEYKNIKGCYKNKYNLYIDFYDYNKSKIYFERFFISDFFDNSYEMLDEINNIISKL